MARLSGRLLALVLRALSTLSLDRQRALGRLLGRLAWLAHTDGRRVTLINLRACFPGLAEAGIRSLGRDSLANTAMLITELGALYHWDETRWRQLAVETRGESLIEETVGRGRGVLVLVPHLGNWEYLALVLGKHRVTALYDPPRLQALEPIIRDARTRAGARLLPIDAGGLRGIYQALAEGGVAALLPDQVPARQAGVYADFFGRPALTMTFAHRLARRTGARVLLGSAVRCAGGFRVSFEDPGPALNDPDPDVSVRAMNQAIEELVRRDPAQYQWEYKRFKRPPPGERDPYRER